MIFVSIPDFTQMACVFLALFFPFKPSIKNSRRILHFHYTLRKVQEILRNVTVSENTFQSFNMEVYEKNLKVYSIIFR